MNKVSLFTDSTCDLSDELVKKYDIGIIPLYVHFNTRSYQDNIDIRSADLYRMVKEMGMLPTTSAPTPANYVSAFKPIIDAGNDVLYISISSRLSSSYENACTAAKEFPEGRVRIIDSLNLSTGIGLQVLTAADSVAQGSGINEVADQVLSVIDKVQTEFVIDSLQYLYKGGRCNAVQMIFSSVLKIHPVIEVTGGSMHMAAKIRGGRQQVLNHMLNDTISNLHNIDPRRVFVTHSEDTDEAVWIKNKLAELNKFKEILITDASCVISSHCGPKTVGILYLKK